MQKLFFTIFSIGIFYVCNAQLMEVEDPSQDFLFSGTIFGIAFFPVFDSLGNLNFIRRSDAARINDPEE